MKRPVVLTIAGFDPSGGAGILADLKTFFSLDVTGVAVVTAITAQNFTRFLSIEPVSAKIVRQQLEVVLEQLPVKAIKIGMVNSEENCHTIFEVLTDYSQVPIVIDPVIKSTTGNELIQPSALDLLKEKGFPMACLITPNREEAEFLAATTIEESQEFIPVGKQLYQKYKVPFLIKGGHLTGNAIDTLYDSQGHKEFEAVRVENINSHGSGCTLSAAIISFLAKGEKMRNAVLSAKKYLTKTLQQHLKLAKGLWVINHFPYLK